MSNAKPLTTRALSPIRAIPAIPALLALLLVFAITTVALAPPALSREVNEAPTGGCKCEGAMSDIAKKQCDIRCELSRKGSPVAPSTGANEAQPAGEQVCCRSSRGFRFIYSWTTPAQCKPPQRSVMATPAKCPLQRSQ